VSSAVTPRSTPQKKPHRKPLRILLITLLVLILFFPAFGFAAIQGWVPTSAVNAVASLFVSRQPGAIPWAPDQPVNVLVMGVQVSGAATNPLTDSMMVVSYHPGAETLSLLSIPRDLWVNIPGHGQSRINEAFEYGGAPEAMLTVQQNLGIPVNYYALVSYTAFEKLIDDVGGVTVDVPFDIDDPTFPAPDYIHYEPFHLKKGVQHLSGHDALRYVRTRHSDPLGDIGRAQRQQQVLMALKDQLLKPQNIFKAGLILRDIRNTVRTNFPFDQAAGLGTLILQLEASQIKKGVLGYENKAVQGYVTPEGAQVLLPNKTAIKPIVADLFGPSLEYLQAGATVRVDNGNGYPLAATNYSKILANMGVKTVPPGNADHTEYHTARVQVFTDDAAKVREAGLLAGMLGVPLEQGEGEEQVDIVITLGRDYAPFVKLTPKDWEELIQPQ
jgi:LCP family protein required for cell wall assembly